MTTVAEPAMTSSSAAANPAPDPRVARAQAGDTAAFESLLSEHFGLVYTIAYARLRHREAAEDLAQEVFLRAWLNIRSLRDGAGFGPWIGRMTRNLAIDWQRRGERHSKLLTLVPMDDLHSRTVPDSARSTPREAASRDQEEALLRQALDRLPARDRELILMHYSRELSKTEIGRHFGVHATTIGRHLERAVERLQRLAGGHAVRPENLRQTIGPMAPPRPAASAHAFAVVAAASSLSPQGQAMLAAAAKATGAASSANESAGLAGLVFGFLKTLPAACATGIQTMGTTKFITGTVVAAALGGGAIYLASDDQPKAQASTADVQMTTATATELKALIADPTAADVYRTLPTNGLVTIDIPFGQTVVLDTNAQEYQLGQWRTAMTAEDDYTLAAVTHHDFTGAQPWTIHPDRPGDNPPSPPGTSFGLNMNPDSGSFVVSSAVLEKQPSGLRVHIHTAMRQNAGYRWQDIQNQYNSGQLDKIEARKAILRLLMGENMLPEQELSAQAWRDHVAAMDW